MNCDEIRRHWNLYHDSEGDAELHWTISQHLDDCPSCAEWFAKQSRFEDLLAEKLGDVSGDEQVWQRVLAGAQLARPATNRRWFVYSSLVACAASLLLLVSGFWLMQLSGANGTASLSHLAAEWHEQLTSGQVRAPFESESDLKVEDYLLREVDFPVRCPPRKDSGFAVQGAGTCRLGDQPTAYVVGRVDDRPVSLFILSRESLAKFPQQRDELSREAIHQCREGKQEMALSIIDKNVVLVIGPVPQDQLARVLKAYGTYPHQI